MKTFLIALILFTANVNLYAQGGFIRVVNSQNPITTILSPGLYLGAAWIDYDNDNDVDLFASPNLLFRNDGNAVFVQVPNPFGFTPLQNPGGCSWADLNADGFIDCILAQKPSGVFLNNGNGTFNNISAQVPSFNSFPAWGCAIGDWNKDPYPDFCFAYATGFLTPGPFPSKLYLNTDANVTPQFITGYELTDSLKPYTVPYWSDFDLDGDMDLFVASGPGGAPGPDYCYKNLKMETGADSLQRMTTELFASQPQDGQCYNFIDFDNDGDLDLCLTNYSGAASRFYVNNGGVYTLQTLPFTTQTSNLSNDWGDFDNDGDLDLIITNDQASAKYYKNNGNSSFSSAINLNSFSGSGVSNGDFDNDGDLDIFINGKNAARALFLNDSAALGNHWINIKCNGTISNKSALGTIVKIKATIFGNSYWQMREINAQNAFQSQNDLRVHFGLGDAVIIDSLLITYPNSPVEIITNVAADNFYCNEEGTAGLCTITSFNEPTEDINQIKIYPNPVYGMLSIDFGNTVRKEEVALAITDIAGRKMTDYLITKATNQYQVSTFDWLPGVYVATLETSTSINRYLFIKQ